MEDEIFIFDNACWLLSVSFETEPYRSYTDTVSKRTQSSVTFYVYALLQYDFIQTLDLETSMYAKF